ncbi:MAG TPA: twin-arginine translocase TatA/TatE family subunit [Pirellulales bacterium]|jgi:sec-independent protein translocase protein TatA|nr:twin-arginine translocase TatA/TatE family subunit [Pirellulales bacterium]
MLIGGAMLFAFLPGPSDMMVIGVVAVLLFGKNLPQVARQAGRALSELKKGMAGIQSELNSAIYDSDTSSRDTSSSSYRQPSSSYSSYRDDDDRDEQTAPKFEPPPAEPSIEGPRA